MNLLTASLWDLLIFAIWAAVDPAGIVEFYSRFSRRTNSIGNSVAYTTGFKGWED